MSMQDVRDGTGGEIKRPIPFQEMSDLASAPDRMTIPNLQHRRFQRRGALSRTVVGTARLILQGFITAQTGAFPPLITGLAADAIAPTELTETDAFLFSHSDEFLTFMWHGTFPPRHGLLLSADNR
jgi:hypothetical protein